MHRPTRGSLIGPGALALVPGGGVDSAETQDHLEIAHGPAPCSLPSAEPHHREVKTFDHTELVRRLDEDGMALPNGRSLVATDAAWRDFLARLKDGNWSTTWPGEQGRSPSTVMDFA